MKWFFFGLVVPFIGILGIDLATSRSSIPPFQRLVRLEDFCSYGICFIFPIIIYSIVLFGRWLWNAWLRFRNRNSV